LDYDTLLEMLSYTYGPCSVVESNGSPTIRVFANSTLLDAKAS
ncbi:unnamed protein product, partial [Rotaria sordida]